MYSPSHQTRQHVRSVTPPPQIRTQVRYMSPVTVRPASPVALRQPSGQFSQIFQNDRSLSAQNIFAGRPVIGGSAVSGNVLSRKIVVNNNNHRQQQNNYINLQSKCRMRSVSPVYVRTISPVTRTPRVAPRAVSPTPNFLPPAGLPIPTNFGQRHVVPLRRMSNNQTVNVRTRELFSPPRARVNISLTSKVQARLSEASDSTKSAESEARTIRLSGSTDFTEDSDAKIPLTNSMGINERSQVLARRSPVAIRPRKYSEETIKSLATTIRATPTPVIKVQRTRELPEPKLMRSSTTPVMDEASSPKPKFLRSSTNFVDDNLPKVSLPKLVRDCSREAMSHEREIALEQEICNRLNIPSAYPVSEMIDFSRPVSRLPSVELESNSHSDISDSNSNSNSNSTTTTQKDEVSVVTEQDLLYSARLSVDYNSLKKSLVSVLNEVEYVCRTATDAKLAEERARANFAEVFTLLEDGAPVSQGLSCIGAGVLHYGALLANVSEIEKLIGYGADPRRVDNYGGTVLHYSVSGTTRDPCDTAAVIRVVYETARNLSPAGGFLCRVADSRGLSPIHMWAESAPRLFRAAEEDPNSLSILKSLEGLNHVLEALIDCGADVKQRTTAKNLTALDIAFHKIHPGFTRFGKCDEIIVKMFTALGGQYPPFTSPQGQQNSSIINESTVAEKNQNDDTHISEELKIETAVPSAPSGSSEQSASAEVSYDQAPDFETIIDQASAWITEKASEWDSSIQSLSM